MGAGPSCANRSVGGLGGVDLVHPGADAAADVHGVVEAGAADDGQHLGGADAGLAVQDHLLVLRELAEGLAGLEVPLGDQDRAGDLVDVPLDLLADVDQDEVLGAGLPLVQPSLELADADGVPGDGLGGLVGDGPAEGVVVDQLGDGRVLPQTAQAGSLRILT